MFQKKLFFLQTAALVLLYLLCLLYDATSNPYEKQSHSLCCLLLVICSSEIINSILAAGTISLKVRLDVFSIYSNYNRIFLW